MHHHYSRGGQHDGANHPTHFARRLRSVAAATGTTGRSLLFQQFHIVTLFSVFVWSGQTLPKESSWNEKLERPGRLA